MRASVALVLALVAVAAIPLPAHAGAVGALVLTGSLSWAASQYCSPVGTTVHVRGTGAEGTSWTFEAESACNVFPLSPPVLIPLPFGGAWSSAGGCVPNLLPMFKNLLCLSDPVFHGTGATYQLLFCEERPVGCSPQAGGEVSGVWVGV